jgi:hypothetical protein
MAGIDNLTPFKKGHKLSQGIGRPKGSKSLSTLLQKALTEEVTYKNKDGKTEKKQVSEWLIAAMIRDALKGNINHIREVFDRIEGKPLQTIDSKETIGIDLSTMTDEQLERLIAKGE